MAMQEALSKVKPKVKTISNLLGESEVGKSNLAGRGHGGCKSETLSGNGQFSRAG